MRKYLYSTLFLLAFAFLAFPVKSFASGPIHLDSAEWLNSITIRFHYSNNSHPGDYIGLALTESDGTFHAGANGFTTVSQESGYGDFVAGESNDLYWGADPGYTRYYALGNADGLSNIIRLPAYIETPTPTVLPTPTVTATPTPSVSSLNVPVFKQTSNPWQSQTYDSANLWSPANSTINRWGCAVTSAAMVFAYHGINKLPDGTILDPGSLNKWLKNQKDGYVREGWVNWLALSRLSKLAKNINGLSFDALEYKRVNSSDKAQLTTDINSSIPDILEQPGHFIVGKGIQGNTFSINDPFYNRQTLNDGYANTFLSLGRFVPSHTNLSYIMLVTDPDISLKILNGEGDEVATGFTQQPMSDPTGNGKHNTSATMLYFEQPSSGEYEVVASGPSSKTFTLSSFLYDVGGNVSSVNQQGITTSTSTNSFVINFDQNNTNNSKINKDVTFQSTIVDIRQLEKRHLINRGIADALIDLTKNSKREFEKGREKNALHLIDVAIKIINKSNKKLVDEKAREILSEDFKSLKKLINN